MKGPATSPYFDPNPNGRELGWINATVGFNMEQTTKNKDGWLKFNKADPDPGVGRIHARAEICKGYQDRRCDLSGASHAHEHSRGVGHQRLLRRSLRDGPPSVTSLVCRIKTTASAT